MAVSRLAHGSVPVIEAGWSDRVPIADYAALLQRLEALGLSSAGTGRARWRSPRSRPG